LFSPVRFIQIGLAAYGHLFWWALVRAGLWRSRLTPAQGFSRMLERLGTPFVKLGQGLSMHREFLPDDYVAALTGLQDRVAPFPGEQAVREIERSFGRGVDELFAQFDATPLAAASIAQVHAARLHDGRKVIVKVRRPGIKRRVEQDMRILAFLVRVMLLVAPSLRRFDPVGLVQEVLHNLRKEMDFRQEARNIRRFAEIFKDSTTVFVPPAIEGMQTEWVSVQHMSGGPKIDDPGLRSRGLLLAQAFVDAYLVQFFSAGVFHGDPHPGNLFVLEDGRICFHDFGLVGFLDQETRFNLAAFMQAFVSQDAGWMLDAALDLGVLAGTMERAEFRRGLAELIQDYARLPLREWSFAEALLRIARMGGGRNIRVPHNVLVLMRTVFLMESSVRMLDPDFNLIDGLLAKAPMFVKQVTGTAEAGGSRRLEYEATLALKRLPEELGALVRQVRRGGLGIPLEHRGLETLIRQIELASRRVSLSLVALGLYIASSLLMQHSIGPKLYDFPLFAAIGYALALWLTVHLMKHARSIDDT